MRTYLARRYDRFTAAMEDAWLDEARAEVVAGLSGRIVEIGAGTGKNLPHYPEAVEHLTLVEPSAAMRDQIRSRIARHAPPFTVDILDATAERIPVPDDGADAVVSTLVLCSVPNLPAAVTELRRILRPGGELRLIEHVLSERAGEARWQERLDRLWHWVEGSCHLDHDTVTALGAKGFDVDDLHRRPPAGMPPLFRDIVQGTARRP